MGNAWEGQRLLVVEDDPAMRTIMVRMLKGHGASVHSAGDGREGLEMFRTAKEPYNLILTDLDMPHMSGLELLHAVKELNPTISVILITAIDDDESILDAFRNDAFRYLRKPFNKEGLLRLVQAALRESQASTENSADNDFQVTAIPSEDGSDAQWIELTAPNRQEYLDRFQDFCQLLLGSRLDDDSKNRIRIAVQELGQNAIEWGNRLDDSSTFRIAYRLTSDRIIFRIEDEGRGFNPAAVVDPTIDPIATIEAREATGKRPGGFGIHLARKVMDRVTYNERGNVVFLEKLIPPASTDE